MELQLDSTSLSVPLLVMNQHPLPLEEKKKKTMHTSTYTHRVREKLNFDPWHLAPDPSVWWPIDYVWPRLGNCCLVITSHVVFGSAKWQFRPCEYCTRALETTGHKSRLILWNYTTRWTDNCRELSRLEWKIIASCKSGEMSFWRETLK